MRLADILKNEALDANAAGLNVSGLSADTRTLKPGEAFFALSGTKDDGAKYAAQAAQAGAVAIVCDASCGPIAANVPVIRVQDARLALAHAAARLFKAPTKDFYLAGITGTNGKTTLTYLLEKLWAPEKTGVIGTVNVRYADTVIDASHTTPDPVTLNRFLADMRASGVSAVAMEVSSHALDQKRVSGLDFDAGVFTNLTQDHLDYHKTMAAYFAAKKILFTDLLAKSAKAARVAVINVDDEYGRKLAGEIRGLSLRTFGVTDPQADLRLKSAEFSFSGTKAEVTLDGRTHGITTNLIGLHNVRNVMAALLTALHRTPDLPSLLPRLADLTVPGRLERVGSHNVFVDYAHTPDALENVINALLDVRKAARGRGRLITVFGCGGDRDRTKRPLMGAIAARLSDVALVTSDNPRTEDPEKILADILPGVREAMAAYDGTTGYLVEADRAKALERAVAIARPEDVILVAGKGHETYQIVGTEKRHFDDREILRDLLS